MIYTRRLLKTAPGGRHRAQGKYSFYPVLRPLSLASFLTTAMIDQLLMVDDILRVDRGSTHLDKSSSYGNLFCFVENI